MLDVKSLQAFVILTDHLPLSKCAAVMQKRHRPKFHEQALEGLRSSDRRVRLAASRVVCRLFDCQSSHVEPRIAKSNRSLLIQKTRMVLQLGSSIQETALLTLGHIGREAPDELLLSVLQPLLLALGSVESPLRSLAYSELLAIAKHRNKTPYTLLSSSLDQISLQLAQNLVSCPDFVSETMHFIGFSRQNFFETTLRFTVPSLVLTCSKKELETLSSIVQEGLGVILLDNIAEILAKLFLDPKRTDGSLTFLVDLLRNLTRHKAMDLSVSSLMSTCIVPLICAMVVELGNEDASVRSNAIRALSKAQRAQGSLRKEADLGTFLKPHMLGVISHLNETLHDIQGRKSVEYKRKVIRSMGELIRTVGDSMSSFSPQVGHIVASLQSTLAVAELRKETLQTWETFISTLRFVDVGPFVGRTTSALLSGWKTFDSVEKLQAVAIINNIADNVEHLASYRDEIVSLDGIPELTHAARKLTDQRRNWPLQRRIENLIERINSKNVALATTSMSELRNVLLNRQDELRALSRGDTFETIIARLIRSLMLAMARDSDYEEMRESAYECLGILGALDPDRLPSLPEPPSMTLINNFTDGEEAKDFAVHLIRDLLVDAFHATNDTKHQIHLAFAIQQLMKFCQFTPAILLPRNTVSLSTRSKWEAIPKDQYEILTPLLESRYTLKDVPPREYEHPIYPSTPTYREWVQKWSADLLGTILAINPVSPAITNSREIFGVFRGVLRSQDVTVAHHILPHLVLTVLLFGSSDHRTEICFEINTVLQDQVNPTGTVDKRTLSAQVVFDLMDYLSKWLRTQRTSRSDSKSKTASANTFVKVVEQVLSSIETELMANAALQSKAYARSLRGFEQRIIQLRLEKRPNFDLQIYFERLHQIYAELDEPDGMEGVSAFVLSPSLELQIREHESTGRWTSAQSCWEVRLQQSPDDISLHEGLLKCLKSLGHYDTLRTHIRGVLSRHPDWSDRLAAYEAEAAWIIGDWNTVEQVGDRGPAIGRVLSTLREKGDFPNMLKQARAQVGGDLKVSQYGRGYDHVLQLHLLREVEIIHQAHTKISTTHPSANRLVILQKDVADLRKTLNERLSTTSPAFRHRELILSIRRTTFSLLKTPILKDELGLAWISTSKAARKAGYEQTAYSAALQAREMDAPFAFIQQAKLLRSNGDAFKALIDLKNSVTPLLQQTQETTDFTRDRNLAKAVLLEARWANETDRFERNDIIRRFVDAIQLAPTAQYNYHTCHNYIQALLHGVKYIYQTMPRMLTIWLDLGESKDLKKSSETQHYLDKITALVDKARKELKVYQFFTAYPQIVSRIGHLNREVAVVLRKIMALVLAKYPQQAMWPTVGVMQSNRPERKSVCEWVLRRAQVTYEYQQTDPNIGPLLNDAERLSRQLLKLADDKSEDKKREVTISGRFAYVKEAFPCRMIMPLQDSLVCSLPAPGDDINSHRPFPVSQVGIQDIAERIDIMPSLQKPKKLTFVGTDGKLYPFLCKPHDDLRKDARLMDFNSMINKFLKSASESRRRQLYVRTYAVMPLNEECGLLEWVSHTNALKNIVEKGYARYGKKLYVIFNEWFLATWPEPSAWLASRMAYARTLAVMSMIGYVLGLGDRHGENILFDELTGDTVHVDLNCLFDKGKTFEIPERVPFRLTHNMVDALGVTGVEGVFRKASEITLSILRSNSEALMSVLEAFAHDPLVEWARRANKSKSSKDIRTTAESNLKPIRAKLRGIMAENTVVSVPNQVDTLIKEATNTTSLVSKCPPDPRLLLRS
ncbi:hypothetical protein TREMEDRAFT_32442 [Tremella mesenterica DSM 1558]|uniref:uncharacterized protein n=1 Tax=Tremella mesenterica (strain ATCC 24925 / CBS 8224 / DSM 1558 / NBRC 9311 / NRRL Y-6157 / RJB 2259-6 / UBC 559-6) TaxID=578456 RepID=UPI0003F4995B|nr:uncharacterized protein TREMEDRAFT_32442 [Tremella mesenterica DSM 1558]EIW68190.1 hypothetical protein TREMEDRAFT_32442 [Tremella mesenterica DSM 1558]